MIKLQCDRDLAVEALCLKFTFVRFDESNNNAGRTAGSASTTDVADCTVPYILFLIMQSPESNDQNKMLHQR